jgi:hypothetical protein
MHAHGAVDIVEPLGDGENPVEAAERGRDGEHHAHARLFRAGDHAVDIADELGEIQVAVGINKHG